MSSVVDATTSMAGRLATKDGSAADPMTGIISSLKRPGACFASRISPYVCHPDIENILAAALPRNPLAPVTNTVRGAMVVIIVDCEMIQLGKWKFYSGAYLLVLCHSMAYVPGRNP